MTTYNGLDEVQRCPECDGEPMEYLGLADDEYGQERQWWFCCECWNYYMDEEVAQAEAHRLIRERMAAIAAGQMTLPGVEC